MTTVNQVINDAYFLSEIVSFDYELPNGPQLSLGLRLLNRILDEASLDAAMIPYYKHEEFDSVIGQEIYNIPNLVELETLTFNINTVRFEMKRDVLKRFFGVSRVDNIQSLPFHYYAERALNSTNIYLYFIPSQVFQMKIAGKYALSDVAIGDNMSSIYAEFYIKWIIYRLASEICQFNNIVLSPMVQKQLDNLERRVNKFVGRDMGIEKYNYVQRRAGWDPWIQANILKSGWQP